MNGRNIVYIGKSIDNYIAGPNGELDWLDMVPNPDGDDMGFFAFMERIDALVMGRKTFEMVCSFDVDWPYTKPVYVLSNSMNEIPADYQDKAILISGPLSQVVNEIHQNGHHNLYIDGGTTIQSFLMEDLIDELHLSTIPIVLGDGIPLFNILPASLKFKHVSTKVQLGEIVSTHYERMR